MTPEDVQAMDADSLRRKAEGMLRTRQTSPSALTPSDIERVVHELEVHQVELELQNDELRRSRDEIERERARFTDLYAHAPNGYATLDADGTMGETNEALARLLEREPTALRGRRLGTFVAERDRPAFNAFLSEVLSGGTPSRCEVSLAANPDFPRRAMLQGVRSVDGAECRVSVSDITDRWRAEAALRLRDRAVRAVTQGILITNPQVPGNPIIYANPGFEQMTGYSAAEVVGRNSRFLQGAGTDPGAIRVLRDAIATESPARVEMLNYRKDGTPFWNALFVSPVRDDSGTLVQWVGVLVDMTGQRELEQTLRHAQRMEAVGRLAGGIAHDFNNLMSVVNGYTHLIHADLSSDNPHRTMVEEIGRAGEEAATLTHRLLAFSRSQTLDIRVLDLNAIVTRLTPVLRTALGDRIVLRTELADGPAPVHGDAEQLGQMLVNLATNAREAMPQGGTLTVTVGRRVLVQRERIGHEDAPPGAYVLLSVADDGDGMAESTVEHAFEPFFTTKRLGHGAGLGLSIVFGLIKQMQGFVSANSAPGQGTTIQVYLPQAPES